MQIDHIGYAVKNIDKAKKSFEALGYKFEDTIQDNDRNIFISFGTLDNYKIELVAENTQNNSANPVSNYIQKIGACPYHICYKSNDIQKDIDYLQKNKFKITVPLAPAIAFNNRRVVFMYSLSVGLIEIVEE